MTLVDSAASIADSIAAVGRMWGVDIPHHEAVASVGGPLEAAFEGHLPPQEIPVAVSRYREHYWDHGLPRTRAFPGAAEALAAVSALGGRTVVVSAKQLPQLERALRFAGLRVDAMAGGCYGIEKARELRRHGVAVYVGDHPGDMLAAREAGAWAVGVTSHVAGPAQLRASGAQEILGGVAEVPRWLSSWVEPPRTRRLTRCRPRRGPGPRCPGDPPSGGAVPEVGRILGVCSLQVSFSLRSAWSSPWSPCLRWSYRWNCPGCGGSWRCWSAWGSP